MANAHKVEIEVAAKNKTRDTIRQARIELDCLSKQLNRMNKNFYMLVGAFRALGEVKSIVNLAEDIQMSNSRLAVSVGNMRKAAQAQKEIAVLAQETGGGYVALSQLYGRIAVQASAYNLQQKQVAQLTRATARALQISGAGAAEASSATLQLSQALGSGILRGEEFNSLMENAPRLMQALAAGMQVPVGSLRELAAQGMLTTEVVTNALTGQLDTLEKEAAKLPRTVSMAFAATKDSFGLYLNEINMSYGITSKMADALDFLAGKFDRLGTVIKLVAGTFLSLKSLEIIKTYLPLLHQKLVLSREIAKNELINAQRAVATAQAQVTAATGMRRLTVVSEQLIPAQTRLAAAQKSVSLTASAAGFATQKFSSLVAALGGPVGAITAAVSLGATAWALWGDNATKAANKAKNALEVARADTERKIAANEYGTGDLAAQREAIGEARKAVAKAEKQLAEIRAADDSFGENLNLAYAEKKYNDARNQLAEARELYTKAENALAKNKTQNADPAKQQGPSAILVKSLEKLIAKAQDKNNPILAKLEDFDARAKAANLSKDSKQYKDLRKQYSDALYAKARKSFKELMDELVNPMDELTRLLKNVREKGKAAGLSDSEIAKEEERVRKAYAKKAKVNKTAKKGVKAATELYHSDLSVFLAKNKTALMELEELHRKGENSLQSFLKKRRSILLANLDAEEQEIKKSADFKIKNLERQLKLTDDTGQKARLLLEIKAEQAKKEEALTLAIEKRKQSLISLKQEEEWITKNDERNRREVKNRLAGMERADLERQKVKPQEDGDPYGMTGSIAAGIINTDIEERLHEMNLEEMRGRHEEQLELLREYGASKAELLQAQAMQANEIADMEAEYKNQTLQTQLAAVSGFYSGMSQMFKDLYDSGLAQNKTMFKAYKAFAVAETFISTYSSAQKAYGSMVGIPYVGPGLAVAAAAAAVAAGLAKVAAITSQQPKGYAFGGLIGGPDRGDRADNVQIMATPGEYMMDRPTVRHYGLQTMEALRKRMIPKAVFSGIHLPPLPTAIPKSGYADGGLIAAAVPNGGSGAANNTTVKNAVNLHVYDDPQRIASAAFESRAGEEAFVAMLGKDPAKFRQILSL